MFSFTLHNLYRKVILYSSDSQSGCRGTLGCHEQVLGVPLKNYNTKKGCREPIKVGKHCCTDYRHPIFE